LTIISIIIVINLNFKDFEVSSMCSILGLSCDHNVASTLVESLKKMEYRGYDSVGVAIKNDVDISVKKGVGKVNAVNDDLNMDKLYGHVGIGHTRWATHGKVTAENAHPHMCNTNSIGVVHNGIIENYVELRKDLENNHGVTFKSTTDTEVIPNLLQVYFERSHDVKKTIMDAVKKLKGHYAFVALFKTGELVGVKNHEPLILGIDGTDLLLTSDVVGLPENISSVVYLENNQFVIIKEHKHKIFDFKGNSAQFLIKTIPKNYQNVTKELHKYFTEKEIFEQPNTILVAGNDEEHLTKIADVVQNSDYVYVTGSGTSYNIAVIAKYLFSRFAGKKVEHVMASEMKYSSQYLIPNSTLFAISQSGESADVLEAVSIGKEKNSKILSMINSENSSLARESIFSIGLNCGPEIGVAATKSFTSQMAILYKIVDKLCDGCINVDFKIISDAYTKILSDVTEIQKLVKDIKDVTSLFVIGRGIHYPIAKEAALKIKK